MCLVRRVRAQDPFMSDREEAHPVSHTTRSLSIWVSFVEVNLVSGHAPPHKIVEFGLTSFTASSAEAQTFDFLGTDAVATPLEKATTERRSCRIAGFRLRDRAVTVAANMIEREREGETEK